MRFLNEGVAYAHLALQSDNAAAEAAALSIALEKLNIPKEKYRITFLTGQADLLLEVRLGDLRVAFELEYATSATAVNWLFAVPVATAPIVGVNGGEFALTYVIHLRVHRDIYRSVGGLADQEILKAILAAPQGRIDCEVLAGFGWSDLLLRGRFASIEDFASFVSYLRNLRLPSAGDRYVFRRMLTLIGYDSSFDLAASSDMVLHPVIFARCLPTHLQQAADFLKYNDGQWRTLFVDGKWDVLSLLEAPKGVSAPVFIREHFEKAISGGNMRLAGVERLETHLITFSNASEPPTDKDEPRSCSCASAVRSGRELLGDPEDPRSSARALPQALVVAVRNVLNLLKTTSRETTNCCDIVPSLVRCEIGLDRLLAHHRELRRRLAAACESDLVSLPERARLNERVVKARSDIEEWCTYAERIVSQRTAGRFDEFLTQNERVVSYRGGVQQLLYLTDALLNGFAQRVLPSNETAFMSLFDPVDIVLGHHIVGFVRVPVRYLFTLPLAIAHLWHEVGVHRFYTQYRHPFDERTRSRLSDFRDATGEREDVLAEAVLYDLADTYGDAVTFAKGFGGNYGAFAISLSSTLFETDAFRAAPPSVQDEYLVALLSRLYMVAEFQQRYLFVRRKMQKSALSIDRAEIDNWIPDPKRFVWPRLQRIVELLRGRLLDQARYRAREIQLRDSIVDTAWREIGSPARVLQRQYLKDLAWQEDAAYAAPPSACAQELFEHINAGTVVVIPEDVDINDLFLLLQQKMVTELANTPDNATSPVDSAGFFLPVAALVRSSVLAYYQREMTPRPRGEGIANVWRGRLAARPKQSQDIFGRK
ncbi:MAG TPA: hypothetical protein VGQ76_15355 [Thermoanaerobaculia bacterium]|jgi:hypothetical protein|nr:hypothetical protein [Thermoanaerobaculia bacterium]